MKKGDKTRNLILDRSKAYFSAHGYSSVTMKDLCEACEISRGGLYRYFSSTKDIFMEILNNDKYEKVQLAYEAIAKRVPAQILFQYFLQDRKATTIVGPDQGFTFAVAEFIRKEPELKDFMKERRCHAQTELSKIIRYGQELGEFRDCDVSSIALTILLILDSLEINAQVLEMTEAELDEQFTIITNLLLKQPIKHRKEPSNEGLNRPFSQ